MSPIVSILIVVGVFILIPILWKLIDKYKASQNEWTDFTHTVFTVDDKAIYLAGPLNQKAKKSGRVTEDNCTSKIYYQNKNIVYTEADVEHIIPIDAIEKIMTGREYYSVIRMSEGEKEAEVVIKLKTGTIIHINVGGESMPRISQEGYNNTVIINKYFTEQDRKYLIDTIYSWL